MRDIFDDLDDTGDIFDQIAKAAPPVLAPPASASAPPNFFTYRPPSHIDVRGEAPAPRDQNVPLPPNAQIPFRRPAQSLETYQPRPEDLGQESYPGQHLQQEADRAQPGPIEFGQGFAKGAARAVSMGTYRPAIPRIEQEGSEAGQLAGGMAPLALAAIPGAAPFVIPAMVAQQGLPATAGDVDTDTGRLRHPVQAVVSVAMAEAMAVLPPAVGKSLAARGLTGAGIGELQSLVTQAIDAKARGGELDLTSPEAVKDQVTQTIFGLAFGLAHGGEGAGGRAPIEYEAPAFREGGEARQPIQIDVPPAPEESAMPPRRDIFDAAEAGLVPEEPIPSRYPPPEPMRAPEPPPAEEPMPAEPMEAPVEAPPAPMPEAIPEAPIGEPATPSARDRYMQGLREAGIPEEKIQAGMQLVDKAPIRDIFDQVDIRAAEPEPPPALPEEAPAPPEPATPQPIREYTPPRQGLSYAKFLKAKDYLTYRGKEPTEAEIASFVKDLGDQPVPMREDVKRKGMSLPDQKNRSFDIKQTEQLLRGLQEENQYTTPVPARELPTTFDLLGERFTQVKARDPGIVRYKDAKGRAYTFKPDDLVHTGGELQQESSLDQAAPEPEEWNQHLWQKGPGELEALRKKYESRGIALDAYESKNGGIRLHRIVVPKENRGQGHGTEAMKELVAYADRTKQPLALSPSADFGGSVLRLKEFYKRLGFVENKGRNKDFAISESMYRLPRGETARPQPVETAGIPESHYENAKVVEAAAKAWKEKGTDSPFFRKWFGNSKAVDPAGKPITVYHGLMRADRMGDRFLKSRATSGPMAFFTDDPKIASNYASGKPDNSLHETDYHGWYKVPVGRQKLNLDQAWWHISPEERARIAEMAPKLHQDDEGNIVVDPTNKNGIGNYDWEVKQARGNHLKALVESWLSSGSLFDQEEKFAEVLRKAGLKNFQDDFPTAAYPGVVPAHLSIQNPLNTREIHPDVVAALERAASRRPEQTNRMGADAWDKDVRYAPREWVRTLKKDMAAGDNSFVWTSIPDWVTKTLKGLGYDGIRDTGGKQGGQGHDVWIPFEPNQIKSATGNRGTFDAKSPNILYQKGDRTPRAAQEDIFANRGRVAAQGTIKAKPTDKGEAGLPLFGEPEREAQARADEDQQRLLQPQEQGAKGSFHMEGKRAIITLFKGKADFSTWMHEHAHLLRRAALSGQDEKTIMRWLEGEGITVADEKGNWTVEAEEAFARGFERYLRDGKAPAHVKPLYEKIKTWMREIYQTLRGSALERNIPEHVRWVYDRLVGLREPGGTAWTVPDGKGGKLYQDEAPKESYGPDRPGPLSLKEVKEVNPDIGHAISYDAEPGNPASGWVTPAEKLYTEAVNEAYPIEKIQKVFEKTMLEKGQKVHPDQSIKLAINRVLGSGGSANLLLAKRLKPVYQGGEVDGIKYPRLTPDEQRMVDQYLIARDTRWRLDNVPGFENPLISREQAIAVERAHKARPPELREKIERAAEGVVAFGKDLVRMKIDAGLPDWTPEKAEIITANPYYVPEVRDFAKVMSKPAGRQKKNLFTSVNRLVRGTFAVDVDAPVFDPLTALIHDAHQLQAETAKMAVWNRAIDLVEVNPTLKEWIKRMPKDWEPGPSEGVVAVIRPGQIHLEPHQLAMAEELKRARYTLEHPEGDEGTEKALKLQRDKILAAAKEGRGKRDLKSLEKLLNKVGSRREAWKGHRQKEAFATEVKIRKMPEAERQMIEDWLLEGKPVKYRVPKEIADAVAGMTPPEWAFWQKPMIAAASLFRKMQVGWNPDFTLSNTPRDVQEAYYNVGLKPWMMFKGLYHYMKQDKVFEAFQEHGGSMEGDESGFKPASDMGSEIRYGGGFLKDRYNKFRDPKAFEGKKARVLGKEIPIAKLARMAEGIKKTIGVPFEMAEAIGEAGEMMTRLGVMDMALNKKKLTPAEAADLARTATLDFKRIGSKMKGANAMIPFLNARIQGTDRMLRTAIENPGAAATRALISAAAPTIALLAWNMQNPNYSDIPASEKEYYWILMKDRKNPFYFKIAKGFLPQLITNPMQMTFENLVGTAKKDWWKIGLDTFKAGLPVDDVSSALNPAVKIPLEQTANYDFYFDRDIVKKEGRSPSYQYDPGTAETLKTIGRALNLSPQRLQHIGQSLLGGTSTNILFALDLSLGTAGLQPKKKLQWEYAPFVKRVMGQAQDWKSDLAQKQRELGRKLAAKTAALKSYQSDMSRADEEGDAAGVAALERGMEKDGEERDKLQEQLDQVQDAIDAVEKLKQGVAKAYKANR